ncbi:MAG TPA: hypothetical protein PKO41_07270 [Dokdonella sp.]|nr:hypothetical protein [Dokdonella sp.]HNS27647.1 hypothetical protein [Steroidobacteraceae bacterium]
MPTRRAALLALGSAVVVGAASATVRAQAPADSARATFDLELESCGKALRRVARLFSSGFGRDEADRLAREIDALPSEQRGQWTFTVGFEGGTATLAVQALVDDLSMVDLDFTTSPEIATRIRKAIGNLER